MNESNKQLRDAVDRRRRQPLVYQSQTPPPETGSQVASALLRWLLDPTDPRKEQTAALAIDTKKKEK